MKLAFKIWKSIKRNPVINAFLIAVLVQILQDWQANNIDYAHILGYISTVFIAVVARMFTVPIQDNERTKELFGDAIERLEVEYNRKLDEILKKLETGKHE